MSDDDSQEVPYEKLIKHFDRPVQSPSSDFNPEELPEEVRELYDNVMVDYYSHVPSFPTVFAKEKSKYDLITRTQQHVDTLDAKSQSANSDEPELLDTVETKELTRQEIKKIVESYRNLRPTKRSSTRP